MLGQSKITEECRKERQHDGLQMLESGEKKTQTA